MIYALELVQNRNQETLKAIIEKHVKKGNIIISDSWAGYHFLDSIDSGYTRHIYNHGHGNFGHGIDSTSRIESIWAEIKALIKKFYYKIPSKNFVICMTNYIILLSYCLASVMVLMENF